LAEQLQSMAGARVCLNWLDLVFFLDCWLQGWVYVRVHLVDNWKVGIVLSGCDLGCLQRYCRWSIGFSSLEIQFWISYLRKVASCLCCRLFTSKFLINSFGWYRIHHWVKAVKLQRLIFFLLHSLGRSLESPRDRNYRWDQCRDWEYSWQIWWEIMLVGLNLRLIFCN